MIQVEYFMTRDDGVILNRTYSDQNFYIERDGVQYSEAVDPAELNRTYTETDILIEEPEVPTPIDDSSSPFPILNVDEVNNNE